MKDTKSKKYEYIYSYNTKGGKKWKYRYKYYTSLGERKEATKSGFTTEKSAYKALLEIQVKTVHGHTKEIEHSSMRVKEWAEIWYVTYENDWKVNTRIQRRDIINHQIVPLIGNLKISNLNVATYKRDFINELLKNYKPSTVDLFHTIFMICLNAAVNNEILDKNRLSTIILPESKKKENYLNDEELHKFLAAAKETENITTYTLIVLLAYSGIRVGEALGLSEEDISFDNNFIAINRTRDGRGVHTPKTLRSNRKVRLDPVVMKQLKKYLYWVKKEKFRHGRIQKPNDFLFISYQTLNPLSSNSTSYLFKRVCKHAGIKHITPHGLRHTHATLLLKDGKPVISVAKRLGNSPSMIMNVYGHVLESMEDDLVDSFSDNLKIIQF